jgi:cytochrome P450
LGSTAVTAVDDLTSLNLADPATHADHDLAGYWQLLRDSMPVYHHPETEQGPAFWVVSRHVDISAIYKDGIQFTSEKGNVLTTLLRGGDTAAGKMLAVTDGQRQRELRNVLSKAFSPRILKRVAEQVHRATREIIRESVARGSFDFASEVAERIPMGTICDLLGVPDADRPYLLRLNKSALSSEDPSETYGDAWAARNEILMYFAQLAAERKENPRDDVITAVATGSIGSRVLTVQEIIFNCYSLIIGGDETTRLAMTCAVHAFTEHPDQWLALKRGDAGMRTAVEEVLRWATPAMHFGRVALREVQLHDRLIEKGDIVTLWNCSANRDDTVFADPAVFDLNRDPNRHLTFGHGPHFCLGAYLARVEISALLTSLVEFVDRIKLAGPVGRVHSNFLSGISHLPVTVRPAGSGHSS